MLNNFFSKSPKLNASVNFSIVSHTKIRVDVGFMPFPSNNFMIKSSTYFKDYLCYLFYNKKDVSNDADFKITAHPFCI